MLVLSFRREISCCNFLSSGYIFLVLTFCFAASLATPELGLSKVSARSSSCSVKASETVSGEMFSSSKLTKSSVENSVCTGSPSCKISVSPRRFVVVTGREVKSKSISNCSSSTLLLGSVPSTEVSNRN